ncbi:cell wall-binding repeat-containing protein [Kineococcus sp. NPDC059986]|uniref:cell wall-binding repeat-containing protein n=1 Tax=Kineococcus sp. NPDC059986 TaxID=3155538 RepID=UPI00344CC0D4
MTAATSRLRRRGIGAGVAALVGLSGLGFAAMPAQAAAGFNPAGTQVSGVDRFDTAAQIATKAFPGGSSTVVVANGDRAIDAQAGAYAAGLNNAPILLTQKSNVPAYTVNAIKTLKATKAIVLGDSNSVDATAIAQMTAAGLQVQVVSGSDRFATAAAIYNLGSTKSSTVFLARADLLAGQVSPDALAASPLSFDGTPVLLTNAGSLPAATASAITSGGVKNVVVLGNAITDSVKTAVTGLGATVTTIAGDDRSLTAQKIAEYGIQQGKYQRTTATIANGDKIDALAAGPWAAKNNAPILLTLGTNALGTGTTNYLTANASTLVTGVAFGDTNSVPTSLTAAAKTAGGGDVTTNATLNVTPTDAVLTGFSTTRQYSVTGLAAGSNYRVTLVNTANVTRDANGVYSFVAAGTPKVVTPGTVGSLINVVNGVSVTGAQSVGGIAPAANGSISFTVSTPTSTAESFVPVVYVDGGADTRLEVDANNRPTETFGVGGRTTVLPPAATFGASTVAPGAISAISLTDDYLTGDAGSGSDVRFAWDSNDTFQYQGLAITQAQFESAISLGQGISISYNPAASGVSTFNLGAEIAPSSGDITAAGITSVGNFDAGTASNDVRVVLPVSPLASAGTVYTLQRKLTSASDYTTVTNATVTPDAAAGTITFTDNNVTPGAYTYRVVATLPVTGTVVNGTASTTQTITAPADTTAPKSVYAALTTSGGLTGSLDAGDTVTIAFDRAVAAVTAGDTIRVRDADGTIVDLVAGTGSTWTLPTGPTVINGTSYATGQVLTIAITAAPTTAQSISGGTTAGVQLPATIIDQSGTATSASVNWDLAGSSDVTIN